MGKKRLRAFVAFLAVAFIGSTAVAGNNPDVITLEAKKGKVTFQHHKHQEHTKCGDCHHYTGPDGKQVLDEKAEHAAKCDSCHNKEFPNKKLNKPIKAFHANCKGCHKAQGKGPTKCKGCHKK